MKVSKRIARAACEERGSNYAGVYSVLREKDAFSYSEGGKIERPGKESY